MPIEEEEMEEEEEEEEEEAAAVGREGLVGGMMGAMVNAGTVVLARVRWAGMGWMGETGRVGLRMDFTAGMGASCTQQS